MSYKLIACIPTACANRLLSFFSHTLRDSSEVDTHKAWKPLKRSFILQLTICDNVGNSVTENSMEIEGFKWPAWPPVPAGGTIFTYFQKARRLLLACLPQTPSAEPYLRAERRKDTYQRPGWPGRHFASNLHTHKWSVMAGREEGQTDLYLILTLLPWQSKQRKKEMVWKRKEKGKIDRGGAGKEVLLEKQTKQQNEK